MVNEALTPDSAATEGLLRELLGQQAQGGCFVSELRAAARRRGVDGTHFEEALVRLSETGTIIVADHFCADPHLEGVDLRIVASAQGTTLGEAHERIERIWSQWLGQYLANHRCG